MAALLLAAMEQPPEFRCELPLRRQSASLMCGNLSVRAKGWNVKKGSCILGFGIHAFVNSTIEEEFFEREFAIDPTLYHVYAVDWTPDGVNFYVDNELIHRSRQSPRYPMQLMLNVYEIPGQESGGIDQPVYPNEFAVDYVRCYQREVD